MAKANITVTVSPDLKYIPVEQMNPAPYNPRVDLSPDSPEYQHIKNSLDSFGYLDPIVWNKRTGNIVSGHQRYKIMVDGGATELMVRVVDFDEDTEKACNLAMNKAVGLWDEEKLNTLLEEMKGTSWDMSDFGFDLSELEELDEDSDNPYTQNVITPTYTPTGEKYDPEELYDTTKADQLLAEIEGADLPESVQKFLTFSAYRHVVFNYQRIAEYYASAPRNIQDLMEQSALVIIDINNAIDNGFAILRDQLLSIASNSKPKEENTAEQTIHIVVGGFCSGKSSFVRNSFIKGRTPKTRKDILPLTEFPDCIILGKYDTPEEGRRFGTDCISRSQINDILPQIKKLIPTGKDIVLEGVKLINNNLFDGIAQLGIHVKLWWIKIDPQVSVSRVRATGWDVSEQVIKTECTKAKNIYSNWSGVFDAEILDTTNVDDFTQFSFQNLSGAISDKEEK